MSTYLLARVEGNEYVFDVAIPQDLANALTCNAPKAPALAKRCVPTPHDVGGATHTVVHTKIKWDKPTNISNGRFTFVNPSTVIWDSWQSLNSKGAGYQEAADVLKAQATGLASWQDATALVLTSPAPADGALRLPIPELELARRGLYDLANETIAGTYFPTAKVPKDVAAYQNQMLMYANAGRRDPNFRRDQGSTDVLDLSKSPVSVPQYNKAKVYIGHKNEKVFHSSTTPPYFPDMELSPELNKAAQFHAEYQAKTNTMGHEFKSEFKSPTPGAWKDPTGKTVSMRWENDRSVYFGGPSNVVEGASGVFGSPHSWMTSNTHFRPFFNVDGSYPLVGFGAAQSSTGNWFFTVVAQRDTELPPKKLDEVSVDLEGKLGANGSGAGLTINVPGGTGETTSVSIPGVLAPAGATTTVPPTTAVPEATTTTEPPAPVEVTPPNFDAACAAFGEAVRQGSGTAEAVTAAVTPSELQSVCRVRVNEQNYSFLEAVPLAAAPSRPKALGCEDIQLQRTGRDAFSGQIARLGPKRTMMQPSSTTGANFAVMVGSMGAPGTEVPNQAVFVAACTSTFGYFAQVTRHGPGIDPQAAVDLVATAITNAEQVN